MSIDYEYTDADDAPKKILKPGEYEAKVTAYEFGMSKTGKDKLTIDLTFEEEGVVLKEDVYFTAAAAWKFDTILKCFLPSNGKRLPQKGDAITINNEFVKDNLLNASGRVVVIEDTYMEKVRSKVDRYLAGTLLVEPGAGVKGQSTLIDDIEEEEDDVPF